MSKWSDPSPQLIRRYRRLAGLTLAKAAELAKTPPAVICNWENGKHKPTVKSITKLAKAYDCDITDFYEADVGTVRQLATNVIIGYFNDPEANKDRKASIASHLLTQLPEETVDTEPEDADEQPYDPLSDLVEGDDDKQ